jgi:hypothetical protein
MLPKRFLELSINSLKQVNIQSFQLNQHNFQQFTNFSKTEDPISTLQISDHPIHLKPKTEETIIAAIDTSTTKLGETSRGITIAVRGATVWRQNKKYRYTRLGPFVFHITDDNKKEVFTALEKSYFCDVSNHAIIPSLQQMPMRIASLLERWLQTTVVKTVNHGVVLFDGSLASSTLDTPSNCLREILASARRNSNVVLAISKATNLRANGYLITDLLPERDPPYLVETRGLRSKFPLTLLGDIYVARLNKAKYGFRMDIDKEIQNVARVEAVERMLGNDGFQQSYPETLRLAHILCTFTANEVLAMQRFVVRDFGVKMINRPDIHRLLFGSFGKGEGYA